MLDPRTPPAQAPPAKWAKGRVNVSIAVSEDGTASTAVPLTEDGVLQGRLTFTLSADRVLRVVWRQAPDTAPVAFAGAWSNV